MTARHTYAMRTTVELDASNRIVLSREMRRAAGIPPRQKLTVSATPGRFVLEMDANTTGRIVKRGKLKIWTGAVPVTPIEEAVEQTRHHTRCFSRYWSHGGSGSKVAPGACGMRPADGRRARS